MTRSMTRSTTQPMNRTGNSDALNRVIQVYESLTPESLTDLEQLYDADAHFTDPFKDVVGVSEINKIFVDMFESLQAPRFEVLTAFDAQQNNDELNQAFMTWNFHFHRNSQTAEQAIRVHGSTHLVFGEGSRIVIHRDYWDAAGQLYERMPVLGSILSMLRRKISA